MRTLPHQHSSKRSLDWISEDNHPHLPKRSSTSHVPEWSPTDHFGGPAVTGSFLSSEVHLKGEKNSFHMNVGCPG